MTKAEAETEYIIKGEIIIKGTIIREETLLAGETLTPLRGNREHSNKEYRLNELLSINIFIIKDKIISNTKFFADIISY